MIGFFDNENTGAVTASVLVKERNSILLRLQALEYIVIKFTRKLFEFVDSIYVTPGPLAMYRMKHFLEVGKFDEKNMTEDIEITWRILEKGYEVKMSMASRVYTIAPSKLRDWFNQRIRWNMGGIQTIIKHKNKFLKKGMLGFFVLPLFISSWIIGIVGLAFFVYRFGRWALLSYLSTSYSIGANTAILSANDVALNPDVLFFLGIILFVAGLLFTFLSIFHQKEKGFKNPKALDIGIYTFFYLLTYPVILVMSGYKLIRKNKKW